MHIAEEQQELRSTFSRENDPVLPENLDALRETVKQGMFYSKCKPRHIFMYQIHYDGKDLTLDKRCTRP